MFTSRSQRKTIEAFRNRLYLLASAIAISFLILIGQLFVLQIIHQQNYLRRSRSNMEQFVPIIAPRGDIYDRNFSISHKSQPIVSSRTSFNITTVPGKFRNKEHLEKVINQLSFILETPTQKMRNRIDSALNRYVPLSLIDDVDFSQLVKIASQIDILDNINWEVSPKRNYLHNSAYAHVIGYTGKVSPVDLKNLRHQGIRHYHEIGKSGLEKEYDSLLRGFDGRIRRIVDVRRRSENEFIDQKPNPGKILVLTLDHKIQMLAHKAMGNLQGVGGAVIVLKPVDGSILAMVSKPDFNPNRLVRIENSDYLNDLFQDENKPFLNRAIQIKNPPSSTFKPLVGLAALEEKTLTLHQTYQCQKEYVLRGRRNRTFHCWGRHGYNNIIGGIADSCNIFFYNVGLELGEEPILRYARYFGLDEISGIDLPGEITGLVPSDQWKRLNYKQRWFLGDTMNISIGQGFLQFTPIAMALYYAGLINDGIIYQPHLLKEVRNPITGELELSVEPKILREIPLKKTNLKKIREGLRAVVTEGTTRFMNNKKIAIAGKTGTVQTFSITKEIEHLRKKSDRQHAWFIGYGPYDAPIEDIVLVAVFVQYGQSGSGGAAPIANHIFKGIFAPEQLVNENLSVKNDQLPEDDIVIDTTPITD